MFSPPGLILAASRGRTLPRLRDALLHRGLSSGLTHVSPDGSTPRMVDVAAKLPSRRVAKARAVVELPASVAAALLGEVAAAAGGDSKKRLVGEVGAGAGAGAEGLTDVRGPKGSVFSTAIIAGVMGAKRTSDLIPFCHQLNLDKCDVQLQFLPGGSAIEVTSEVSVDGKTGVEMEALTSVSVASLCVYDMLKALSHEIRITDISLVSKTGGKSDFGAGGDEAGENP
jgi:cyclic pyranopterin phosphate synthase